MKLYLIGKSNKGLPVIDDEIRKTNPKRHKWSKGLLLTADATKGTDDTRFPLTRESFCITNSMCDMLDDTEEMIENINLEEIFPLIELSFLDIFEDSVAAVDHITKRVLKSSTQYTRTLTNVDLDPETFPRGIEDLIDMIEKLDFKN